MDAVDLGYGGSAFDVPWLLVEEEESMSSRAKKGGLVKDIVS